MYTPDQQASITDILSQILAEYGGRLDIHGESDILVSSPAIAQSLYETTAPVRTPYGPRITVASVETPTSSSVDGIANSHVVHVDALTMDKHTHAIFGVVGEDPKYILQGLKHTRYALRPKGYAVVISLKQESKAIEGDGQGEDGKAGFQVGLEEKLMYQSKGRVKSLSDVLEYAGFERGRVKSFQMKSSTGDGQEAEVLLAMKWDQLTA